MSDDPPDNVDRVMRAWGTLANLALGAAAGEDAVWTPGKLTVNSTPPAHAEGQPRGCVMSWRCGCEATVEITVTTTYGQPIRIHCPVCGSLAYRDNGQETG